MIRAGDISRCAVQTFACCTHGVDISQREVVDVEFLGDVERRVHHDGRLVRVARPVQDVSQADQRHVLM